MDLNGNVVGGGGGNKAAVGFERFQSGPGADFVKAVQEAPGGTKALDGTSGGTLVRPFFDPNIRYLPQRHLVVRSLLPTRPATGDKIWFLRQTTATQAAAVVPAGGLKPTSVYTVERVEDSVRTIAHVSEALDRSLLQDEASLSDFINNQLTLGVLIAEENQIINGNGVGGNFRGILSTTGILSVTRGGSESRTDAVYRAITALRLAFYEADGIVLHPTDWQSLRMAKDANGNYMTGDVLASDPDRLWGIQVVTSPVIALGTGLVGNFAVGATVWDREEARVTWAEQGLNDAGNEMYTRNQIRFRGEERVAFSVERPPAWCQISNL